MAKNMQPCVESETYKTALSIIIDKSMVESLYDITHHYLRYITFYINKLGNKGLTDYAKHGFAGSFTFTLSCILSTAFIWHFISIDMIWNVNLEYY